MKMNEDHPVSVLAQDIIAEYLDEDDPPDVKEKPGIALIELAAQALARAMLAQQVLHKTEVEQGLWKFPEATEPPTTHAKRPSAHTSIFIPSPIGPMTPSSRANPSRDLSMTRHADLAALSRLRSAQAITPPERHREPVASL